MAMIMDAVLGLLLDELLKEVVNVKDRAVKFRATLITLESTLNKVGRLAKQIDGLNNQLNKPAEEMKELKDKLAKGKKLVMECSEIQWWNCCYKANYQEELEALYESIRLYFNLDMQGLILTNELQNQVILTEIHATVMESGPRRTELKGVCSPPAPPAFTVGLDVHLREMKVKLLNNHHHAGSVLTVTGTPGSGKSTLVKKFCCDEEVKGMFFFTG